MRLILATVLLASSVAHADRKHVAEADPAPTDDQVVVVNTAQKLGSIDQIDRMKRVLDQRGLLFRLPNQLEAVFDGRALLLSDLDSVRDAYANGDFKTALKLIEDDQKRMLDSANGDLAPALAQLCAWRGIIATANDDADEAQRQFRAAYRFNPAWSVDKKLITHRARAAIVKAKHEPDEVGTLRVDVDPEDATMMIDGGELRPTSDRVKLKVGLHLVQITAPQRTPYAELVEIEDGKPYKLQISLDAETKLVRAAKLVDETAAVPAGKPRLKRAKELSKLTGVNRILFVEGSGDDHVIVRLYDINLKKVSKSLQLDGSQSSAAIASEIKSAFDPDNMVDAGSVVVRTETVHESTAWYNHWYVWAAAAAVVGGAYLTYDFATREPTSLRGF